MTASVSVYLRCRCGGDLVEDVTSLRCRRCAVVWTRDDNIIDLHPGTSLLSTDIAAMRPERLFVVGTKAEAHRLEPMTLAPLARACGAREVAMPLTPRAAVVRRWAHTDGVMLLCGETGALSRWQQAIAWRARRSLVFRAYPMGTVEGLSTSHIGARALRKLLGAGLVPFRLVTAMVKKRGIRRGIADPAVARAFIARYCPPEREIGDALLDVGCGWGSYAAMMANTGRTVIGLDPYPWPTVWRQVRGAWFCRGIDTDLAITRSERFDGCLFTGTVQYLKDDKAAVREIWRAVKRGGWLLVSSANRDNPWTRRTGRWLLDGDPVQRYYTEAELRALVESAGFRVTRSWAEDLVSPVLPRAAAFVTDVLMPASWMRVIERLVPASQRKVVWVLARKDGA